MIKDYEELKDHINMLNGNLNRICVTDSQNELEDMLEWVNLRINQIYNYNMLRIEGQASEMDMIEPSLDDLNRSLDS